MIVNETPNFIKKITCDFIECRVGELKLLDIFFNPIPAGGGEILPPTVVFFTYLKKYWSEAVEIFKLFFTYPKPYL